MACIEKKDYDKILNAFKEKVKCCFVMEIPSHPIIVDSKKFELGGIAYKAFWKDEAVATLHIRNIDFDGLVTLWVNDGLHDCSDTETAIEIINKIRLSN